MLIEYAVYHMILSTFPNVPPEIGCILGSKKGIICTIAFDAGIPRYDAGIYTPNVGMLNQIIADWSNQSVSFCGFAHSHPHTQKTLSMSDRKYINAIMEAMPHSIKTLYFPLVFPGSEIISFCAVRCGNEIEIKPDHISIYNTKE